jgi:diacylglycerol kinase (ATP)
VHLKLIYNPAAGRGRARRHIGEAERYFIDRGARVEIEESTSPDHFSRIAAESSRAGFDRVVVCGGDGTLNMAVRDFDLDSGTLALLPFGSGDDFAQVLGIPRKVAGACDVVLNGTPREVDVAFANDRRYMGVAGLGFDSEVAEYAGHVKYLRGSLIYLYSIMRVLPRFTPHRVQINGRAEEIMFAAVGNSRQYGGGIRITPEAKIDDGALDLCVVHKTTRATLLKTLPKAYTGAHVRSPFVATERGAEFFIEGEREMVVYADGERVTTTPVRFGVVEKRLKVVA